MKNDIRFLVTNACNYNCYFCHNEGIDIGYKEHLLNVDDYVALYETFFKNECWNGVTLSGGEPLIFQDIDALIKKLREKGANITVVTNGALLHYHFQVMKYVKRLNVSIHTMNKQMYKKIVKVNEEKLDIVKNNLKNLRKMYPKIEIRLNVTPCKNQKWSLQELKNLIKFAEQIKASIKCTELFPNNLEDCITINTLQKELYKLGYIFIPTEDRTMCFEKGTSKIYLTQCTCSAAIVHSNPIEYCRKNHDLYVNCNGTFPLCRLGDESIDFWKDIKERNYDNIGRKMKIAKKRISKKACQQHLSSIYL